MWWYAISLLTTLLLSSSLAYLLFAKAHHVQTRRRNPTPAVGSWHNFRVSAEVQRGDMHGTVPSCQHLLASAWRAKTPVKAGHGGEIRPLTYLEARAGPNQRLVRAFGIDNAFTTVDEDYHKEFRSTVGKVLRTSDQDWYHLWSSAKRFAQDQVKEHENQDTWPLVPLIQLVVFKVILLKFFADEAVNMEDPTIAETTNLINALWIESKPSGDGGSMRGTLLRWKQALTSTLFPHKAGKKLAQLQKCLERIFPHRKCNDPRTTPLNIILPAYETLWRVVLHGVIEILFRNRDRNDVWLTCISDFTVGVRRKPSFLRDVFDGGSLSIIDIAKEGLRLYPPTKRVYRWVQQEDRVGAVDGNPKLCAADIETVHRDRAIWGLDALQFNPERWSRYSGRDSERVKEAFIPFGYGSLSCPAKGEFGPRMIGLLIAVLVEELDLKFDWTADKEEDRPDQDGPLRTARDSYATLQLLRIWPECAGPCCG